MYSRKSVGPRMEPWGTPILIGYFYEDFPSRTNSLVVKTLVSQFRGPRFKTTGQLEGRISLLSF